MPEPHPRISATTWSRRSSWRGALSQVAKGFGISESYLRNWLVAPSRGGPGPGTTPQESEELRELNVATGCSTQNEVLRRAAAYLSRANLKLGQNPE